MNSVLRGLSTGVFLLTAACGAAADGTAGSPIVYDSAGIRIVQNTGQRWAAGEAWTLGARPTLEIGVVDGEQALMLSQIRNPTRLADGSIALINGASREIRVFDRSGHHVRTIGREGQGPGEFQLPAFLTTIPGDSLLVWDLIARRGTVYSVDGVLGRVFSLEERAGDFSRPEFSRRFSDGSLLAFATPLPGQDPASPTGDRWSRSILVRYSPDGANPRILGEVERLPCDPKKSGECSFIAYGAQASFGFNNDRIYASRPDRNEVRVLDSGGQLLSRIVGASSLQPVTEAMKAEFMDAVIARDPSRQAELRAYVSQASFSQVVPAFSGLIVSQDGYVWAREYQIENAPFGYVPLFPPRTAPLRWTVIDPQGVELGDVEVPVNFTISEIGADYVLGVGRDELDVERVQLYSLHKP